VRTNSRRRTRLLSWRNLRARTTRYFNSRPRLWIYTRCIEETDRRSRLNERCEFASTCFDTSDELSLSSAGRQINDFTNWPIRVRISCTSRRIVLCAVYHRPHLLSTVRRHARYKSVTISNVPESDVLPVLRMATFRRTEIYVYMFIFFSHTKILRTW